MAEYIERETYRKRLANLEGWCQDLRKPGLKQALEIFDEIPAADVAPVVHGRWVDGKCSNCGVDIPTDDAHDAIFENECCFCYYCGARMDGGECDAKSV